MSLDGSRRHAREMIGAALITEKGKGGLSGAFDVLETRLRQQYAFSLTETDRNDVRAYISARVERVFELLGRSAPDVWTDDEEPDG